MSGIFLSYRRGDSSHAVDALYDALHQRFRWINIFRDVDTIPVGRDFSVVISNALAHCDVFVAVIGQRWVSATDQVGRRRLDNPADFVRLEVTTALKRGIPVIVVLVDDATMPTADDLPPEIKQLALCPSVHVRPAHYFTQDMDELTHRLLAARRSLSYWRPVHARVLVLSICQILAAAAYVLAVDILVPFGPSNVSQTLSTYANGIVGILVLGALLLGIVLYGAQAYVLTQVVPTGSRIWLVVIACCLLTGPGVWVPVDVAFGLIGPRSRHASLRRFER